MMNSLQQSISSLITRDMYLVTISCIYLNKEILSNLSTPMGSPSLGHYRRSHPKFNPKQCDQKKIAKCQ